MTSPSGSFDPSKVAGSTSPSSSTGDWTIWNVDKNVWNENVVVGTKKVSKTTPNDRGSIMLGRTLPTTTTTVPIQESIGNLLKDFASKATGTAEQRKEFAATQQKLFEAGLYGTDKPAEVHWGIWDNNTKNAILKAYQAVAQQSSVNSVMTLTEYLNNAAQENVQSADEYGDTNKYGLNPDENGAASGTGGNSQPQVVNRFTDPQQVADTVQQAAQDEIGRKLSDKEVAMFVNAYHQLENTQNANSNSQAQTTNITQPDLSSQAESFVEQENPNEVGATRMASYVDALHSLLGTSSS